MVRSVFWKDLGEVDGRAEPDDAVEIFVLGL